jgi:rhodanese-related sulfurtransferase
METSISLPTISPTDAKRLIAQGATLIDIRDRDEHARERIQGARNAPLNALTKFDGVTAPIIFHCRAGKRTAGNAGRLKESAPCEAYLLAGGIDAWKQAGLPVIADRSQPIEIGRQVMIAAGSLVLLGVVLGVFVRPEFYALSGLVGAGLVFAGLSGWCGLGKLLGLMPWNHRPLGA